MATVMALKTLRFSGRVSRVGASDRVRAILDPGSSQNREKGRHTNVDLSTVLCFDIGYDPQYTTDAAFAVSLSKGFREYLPP